VTLWFTEVQVNY